MVSYNRKDDLGVMWGLLESHFPEDAIEILKETNAEDVLYEGYCDSKDLSGNEFFLDHVRMILKFNGYDVSTLPDWLTQEVLDRIIPPLKTVYTVTLKKRKPDGSSLSCVREIEAETHQEMLEIVKRKMEGQGSRGWFIADHQVDYV